MTKFVCFCMVVPVSLLYHMCCVLESRISMNSFLPLQRDNKENSTTGAMKKHHSDDLQHLKRGRPKVTSSRKVLQPQNWLNWILHVLQHVPSFWCYKICFQNFCLCVVLGLVDASIIESCFNPLAPNMWYTCHSVVLKTPNIRYRWWHLMAFLMQLSFIIWCSAHHIWHVIWASKG
jgi:hypothetical protein